MRGRAVFVIATAAGCGRIGFVENTRDADYRPRCTLVDSGPVTATANGQVIENLRIVADGVQPILVDGFSDVVIRNVEVFHRGPGIELINADRARIEDVSVEGTGGLLPPPTSGTDDGNNIEVLYSDDVTVSRARLRYGFGHIDVFGSLRTTLQYIEGYDAREQLSVHFNRSDDGILEDFSFVNDPATSWTSGVVQAWEASNVTVRRGLVDGDTDPTGGGVKFNANGTAAYGGLVEDVDAIRQGNACFNAWGGTGVTFRRTTCRETICTDQGRGLPASGSIPWAGGGVTPQVLGIEASTYFQLCGTELTWPQSSFTVQQIAEVDVPVRAPLAQRFCFDP